MNLNKIPDSPLLSNRCNQKNRISGLPSKDELIHLVNLSSLFRCDYTNELAMLYRTDVQLKLQELGLPFLDSATEQKISDAFIDDLCEQLQDKSEQDIGALLSTISNSLGATEPHWWATFADEINDLVVKKEWYQLVSTLGMGHITDNEWVMVCRYPAEKVEALFRPTVADAGDNCFHFPSPPGEKFGLTMPLMDNLNICRELVHPPLKDDDCGAACTQFIGKVECDANQRIIEEKKYSKTWLPEKRKNHMHNLKQHHNNKETDNWAARHSL